MKKKILFVINTLGRAGAEMAMTALMNKLDESQYEISLYKRYSTVCACD